MPNLTTLRTVVMLGVAALGGCGGFQSDFSAVAAHPPAKGSIEGAWVGTWKTEGDSHTGDLRAIVTRIGQDEYQVRYLASYTCMGFWPCDFEMETSLNGHFSGSTFHFEGHEDLGWPWGGYEYSGYATDEEFFSTYQSGESRGVYELHRPTVHVESEPAK